MAAVREGEKSCGWVRWGIMALWWGLWAFLVVTVGCGGRDGVVGVESGLQKVVCARVAA